MGLHRPASGVRQLHAQAVAEVSHTQGLADLSVAIMERNGVAVASIRAVDPEIATGVAGQRPSTGGRRRRWPAIFETVIAADILVLTSPIWLGEKSSVCLPGDRAPLRQPATC